MPDHRIFGLSSEKLGVLDMKGEVRTYETEEVNKEVIDLKITGFQYGFVLPASKIENACKIVLA